MEEDPMAAMEEENAKLRQSLFNLNKLFAEKFEAVQLNESAQQELSVLREQLEQKDELLTTSGLQNSKLLKELAGVREELSMLAEQLVQTEALLANIDGGQAALKAQLAAALEDAETARATAVAVERIHSETEARAAATKQELEDTQKQLAKAEDELVDTKAFLHSKEDAEKFDMIEIEDEGMEMDEWNIRSLNDKSTGVARLRQMLLDYRKPPATSLLETDEIRNLLKTVRQICADRSLADSSLEPSSAQWLPFPEYLYAWFGSRSIGGGAHEQHTAQAKSRAVADGDCARFLHRLEALKQSNKELSVFYTLLNSCEIDEVSYYMHARRVLLGLNRCTQLVIEVSLATATRACNALIMRHATDAHAQAVHKDSTKRLLSSPGIVTASGGVDSGALLGGLLFVYKEEKEQLRATLQVLHKAGAKLQDYPTIHKVRAMLHSVDPTASDYEILLIYQRCSIAERSEDRREEPERVVPFSMLWVVLQRYGFLIKRQRIGLAYQPDVLHESPALRGSCVEVLGAWLTARPYLRTLVKKAAESDFECERLWAQYAKTVIQQLEAAALTSTTRDSSGGRSATADLVLRLKRLLTSTLCAQSTRHDIAFPPPNGSVSIEDLKILVAAIKHRDALADAAQVAQRSGAGTAAHALSGSGKDRGASQKQIQGATVSERPPAPHTHTPPSATFARLYACA